MARIHLGGAVLLIGCISADPGAEIAQGNATDGDRILPLTDASGALVLDTDLPVDIAEDRFAGLTFTASAGDLLRVGAQDPGALADPVVLVYGPRVEGGGWKARLAKQDREGGAAETTDVVTIAESGTYLAVVGDFERRASSLVVRLERGVPVTVPVRVTITGWIFGDDTSSHDIALSSWQAACDRWVADTTALLPGVELGAFSCGAASDNDASDNYEQLVSRPTLEVTAQLPPDTAPLTVHPSRVAGSAFSSSSEALRSWRAACTTSLGGLASIYGTRLLGATCDVPEDVDQDSWYRYASSQTVTLAPIAGEPVVLGGYVFGANVSNSSEAETTALAACDAWAADAARRFGAERIVSHECGGMTDIDDNSWVLNVLRPTLTVAAAPGSAPPARSSLEVRGSTKSSISEALGDWRTVCGQILDRFAETYGARLAAASCGEPRDVDESSWYAMQSDATAFVSP